MLADEPQIKTLNNAVHLP